MTPKIPFTIATVNAKTDMMNLYRRSREEFVNNMKKDPKKAARLSRQECVYCFYSSRIAGQAFTNYQCVACGKEEGYHNTDTPVLCLNCAKEHDLCAHCMADIELHAHRTYLKEAK